ncbi:MAG TPA: beta-N-acetylhexosaminidase [Kofleriaceae bacterium]|nr:beta-N-acetylhexosaminidase [Kofleriaceae bacterium]
MHDDVGQLLWIGFEGTSVAPELRGRLERGEAGATIVFKRNLAIAGAGGDERCDLAALVELNQALHRRAPDGTPAWIAVDQEGGRVQRVKAPATVWPAMDRHDQLPAAAALQLAGEVGEAMGGELAALGFDIDFAPVLDVHTNPANPIIGDRAFGRDAEAVGDRALAFADGLRRAGIVACGKHFPGHGDTATDSHLELPRIDHDWARLEQVELAPFRAAAARALPMLMTAHVVFAALDPNRPATLSHLVITGLLRDRLGYRGIVISDDLDMRAIVDHIGVDAAAVAAIRAGCDVLLLCRDPGHQELAREALIRGAERDSELRRRIAESAHRVRQLKQTIEAERTPRPGLDVVGSAPHQALAARLRGGPGPSSRGGAAPA